ncbi:MAG TPA: L,D-transpeptidase family protein [Gemmatimonadales bacterium]|nr:L,D-transpeptidase family protein [Gemmatimonadales bacterium]
MMAGVAGVLLVAALLQQRGAAPARSPDDVLAEQIRLREEASGIRLARRATLLGFYARRAFRPAWNHEHGPNRLADDLVAALNRADLEGLNPADYHVDAIGSLLAYVRLAAANGRTPEPARLADLDLLLTDAFLLYGSHLLGGRVDPESLYPLWNATPRRADLGTLLEDALQTRRIARALQRLAPTHEGYQRLRAALARERAFAESGAWPVLPKNPSVALLRERLYAEGDLEKKEGAEFDDDLRYALRRFQARHGLESTGALDPETLAELNVTAEERVRQIALNLERWRWLPQDLGRRRVEVNIAAYELQLIEDDEVAMRMRVVVGREYRRTPVFSDTIRYIVLNPNWYVPKTIALDELIPKIRGDSTYLERFGMHLTDSESRAVDPREVDWNAVTVDNFPFRLRQEPGRLNALGRMKFMFPNRYDVYLHDTPSRHLFAEAQRDFSHGCIRLEKPLDLAVHLMKKSKWDQEAIESALDEGTERTLYLPRPTPIHLLYFTAWADADGTIHFREDINGADQPLSRALAKKH